MKQRATTLLFALSFASAAACSAQAVTPAFSVASAKSDAGRLNGQLISITGHLWIGKEGSMIYDSGYHATLSAAPSESFSAKNGNWFTYLSRHPPKSHSDTITAIGHLAHGPNGNLLFLVDDITSNDAR